MLDSHIHTTYSPDSQADMSDYITEAIIKGIHHLTYTDHVDLLYPHDMTFEFHPGRYSLDIENLIEKHKHQLNIYKGVELGMQKKCILDAELFLDELDPDFVLCSLHTVEDEDLYYGGLFKRYAPTEAMRTYLRHLIEIVERFDRFNVIGHLDLPKRYCPAIYDVPVNTYTDLLDHLFDILMDRNQGIEINSSGLRGPHKRPLPEYEIISHYLQRGGKILTFGSDSHQVDTLGYGSDLVSAFLKQHQVKALYVFKDMEAHPITL